MIQLTLDDSHRLTGKGLVWDHLGAIIDISVSGINKQTVVDCWQNHVRSILNSVGWQQQKITQRIFEDGVSFLISAPRDALYAATEINEAAWSLTCEELLNQPATESPTEMMTRLNALIQAEINPPLLTIIQRAEAEKVPFLVDDDEFSLGYGASTQIWPVRKLPALDDIDWSKYSSIPIAMITGTNGKSTCVRLTSLMVKLSGQCCGITSTDFIRVGEQIIDEGDYSGPMGAGMALRHPQTQMALLEVARGGLLRRGLAVPHIDAALITNIAEDHFGEYGINSLPALTQAKCIVAKALNGGTLVLNADDPQLAQVGASLDKKISWFSLDENNLILLEHRKNKGTLCYLRDDIMVYENEAGATPVLPVNDVAITFNGAARYNIQNALGAIALASALHIDMDYIRQALKQFSSDINDNPGRGNQFRVKGARVIVDFAHNTHSMKAMADTVIRMPAKRRLLQISAAGDRSNADIQSMTEAAMKMHPELLVIAEIETYLRGRELTEVPKLIAETAIRLGQAKDKIVFVDEPLAGAKLITERLQSQDLALILALTQRQEISALLDSLQN